MMRGLYLIGTGAGLLFWATAVGATSPTVTRAEATALERAAEMALTNRLAAVEGLASLRRDGRGSAPVDYAAGNLWAGLEAYDEAGAAYALALDKAPDFDAARLAWGRVLALQGAWTEAEETLRSLALEDTASEDALLLYGHVLVAMERYVSAETIYRRALLAGGESPEAGFGLARCFMAQQRLPEAVAMLEELVARRPDDARFWGLLADAQVMSNRGHAARVTLETARRLGHADAAMLVLLGELHLQQGQPALAVSVFETAMEAGFGRPGLGLRLAGGLLRAGAYDRVAPLLDQIAPDERGAAYWRMRARWAAQRGDREAAYQAYVEWVNLTPLDGQALLAMGDWYYAGASFTDAVLWYERATRAAPDTHEPWLRLAQVALDQEQWAAAEQHLERAQVLHGDASIDRALQQVRRLRLLQEDFGGR